MSIIKKFIKRWSDRYRNFVDSFYFISSMEIIKVTFKRLVSFRENLKLLCDYYIDIEFSLYSMWPYFVAWIKLVCKRLISFRENLVSLRFYYTNAKTDFITLFFLFIISLAILIYFWINTFLWAIVLTLFFSIFFYLRVFELKSRVDDSYYANKLEVQKKSSVAKDLYDYFFKR